MKIFFSGLAGAGVSALAAFMAGRGHQVSGSDRSFDQDPSHPALAPLRAQGIRVVPQDGSGIHAGLDLVVFSTAVESELPEPKRAQAFGLRVRTRPQFLAELVAAHRSFAVAGTSGKSTSSGMLAFLLRELGLEPNFIGGGRVAQFRSERCLGNAITGASDLLVVEACESDGSIVEYRPEFSIILNLDLDHHGIEKTAAMFVTLARNTKNKTLFNADDPRLSALPLERSVSFSIEQAAAYQAGDIRLEPLCSRFRLRGLDFELRLPGLCNVQNALACLATIGELGVDLKDCAAPLARFTGIDRRFNIHRNDSRAFVMDDYAHNPHKIAALMQMARKIRPAVHYVFQPHGFAPARMMKNEYIRTFIDELRPEDRLSILPIYYVGGTVARDIASGDIASGVTAAGKNARACEREALLREAAGESCLVIFGARDESLGRLAAELAAAIS